MHPTDRVGECALPLGPARKWIKVPVIAHRALTDEIDIVVIAIGGPMGLSLGGLCVFPHCRVFAPRAEIISLLPYIFAHENRSSRNALTRKLAIAFGILTEVRHGYNHYANKSTSLRRFR